VLVLLDPERKLAPILVKRVIHPERLPPILMSSGSVINDISVTSLLGIDWSHKDIDQYQQKFKKL